MQRGRCASVARIATEDTRTPALRRASHAGQSNTKKQSGKPTHSLSIQNWRTAQRIPNGCTRSGSGESPEYVRFVRSRRSARRAGNLRPRRVPCLGSAQRFHEHDDYGWDALGRGALQQWRPILTRIHGFGESYSHGGAPQTVRSIPQPTADETRAKGILPEITPLERWEISQPGNVLRVFERGGGPKGEVGEPSREPADAGKPDDKLSTRGFGTLLRTDPVSLGLVKRLACSIPCFPCLGPTINRATIAPAGARHVTSSMRMTVPPNIPRNTLPSAIAVTARRMTRPFHAKSPATRFATNLHDPSHRVSAWSVMSIRARIW